MSESADHYSFYRLHLNGCNYAINIATIGLKFFLCRPDRSIHVTNSQSQPIYMPAMFGSVLIYSDITKKVKCLLTYNTNNVDIIEIRPDDTR